MNHFSENLKKIRKDNNLSQEQLADELCVSRQAISKWESSTAYPEMEKIIQICNRFNVSIDDLLNNDIGEVKRELESKNSLNKYIDDFLNFITDTINLLSNMSFKSIIKCFLEQIIIACFLLIIFTIIGILASEVVESILINIMPYNTFYPTYDVIRGIYFALAFILSIVIMVHIFKTRYLDYFKEVKRSVKREIKDDTYKQDEIKKINDNNKILFKENENKIIIRDPKHSEYRFINGIFKLIVFFIKVFVVMCVLFLSLMLVLSIAGFVISFTFIKTGLVFIGVLIGTFSLIIGLIDLIVFMLNFILDRKNDKKKIIWAFIIAVLMFGVSCGLIPIGALQFKVLENNDEELIKTEKIELEMNSGLTFVNDEIQYVESPDDNLIKVEYTINKYCTLKKETWTSYGKNIVHFWSYCPNELELLKVKLKYFNEKTIIDMDYEVGIFRIYASKENIKKLTENRNYYLTQNK